jgi:serine protease Do
MPRRFLLPLVCLSASVGALLVLVIGGSLSPAPALSLPAPSSPATHAGSAHTPPAAAPGGPGSFADVAERVNPAVVNIDALSRNAAPPPPGTAPRDNPEFFERPSDRDRERLRRGTGTGFLIDADGYILTNEHVIENADRLTVRLTDGRSLRARTIGIDPDTDVALIKVDDSKPLPYVVLGDSDRLRVGEWVVAIGNPLAYEHTVTAGVVSFLGRKLFNTSLDRYIQTDAAINFGNSGGPLIDTRGEVVGINAAISSRAANIGFAVPINQARAILPQLRAGRVTRGYIGIGLRDVDPSVQRSLRLRTQRGALVQDVSPGSPGARAGVRVYDVVIAVDGKPIDGNDQLIQVIAGRQPGTTATLQVLRDNRALTLTIKLAERPRADGSPAGDEPSRRPPGGRPASLVGLTVRDLDADFAARAKLPSKMDGVVVASVEPMSPAFDAQIPPGSVVLEINRQAVHSVRDYQRIVGTVTEGEALTFYLYQPDRLQHALQTVIID